MSVLSEWIEKAEADYKGAVGMSRRRDPLPDLVCYHCQQSVEKYLKAYLVAQGASPPAIHDLRQLLLLCTNFDALLAGLEPLAKFLNPYGVLVRYPGLSATIEESKEAVKAARHIRALLREKLGL
jgi:HEPN domain-containing protein